MLSCLSGRAPEPGAAGACSQAEEFVERGAVLRPELESVPVDPVDAVPVSPGHGISGEGAVGDDDVRTLDRAATTWSRPREGDRRG